MPAIMNTCAWILVILTVYTNVCNAYWGSEASQYHIQTDEGDERYFRYQTQNGQYRKEKRLKDGTVIGTDAWIDAAGFIRAKDYIADDQGYRILKSKTFYVGEGQNIEDAVRTFKSLPSNSITSSTPLRSHIVPVTTYRPTTVYSSSRTTTSYPSYSTSTISPAFISSTTSRPFTSTTYRPETSSTYRPETSSTYRPETSSTYRPIAVTSRPYGGYEYSTPQVFIRHHSQPLEFNSYNSISNNDVSIVTSRPIEAPSQTYLPPYPDNRNREEQLKPIAAITSTPPPIASKDAAFLSTTLLPPISSPTPFSTGRPTDHTPYYSSSTYRTNYPSISSTYPVSSTTQRPEYFSSSTNRPNYPLVSSTFFPEHQNHFSTISPVSSASPRIEYETSTLGPIVPIEDNNIHVKPLYSRNPVSTVRGPYRLRVAPLEYNNNIGNGYDPQFPQYDGVSVNRNGFSYYLPKQYHEEDNRDPNYRQGSFGYIDPFGIRRVTYYNTSPGEGFVHKKNNRYVGHNATPYDPRPI